MMKTNEVVKKLKSIRYDIGKIVDDVGYVYSNEFENLDVDKTNPNDVFLEDEIGNILEMFLQIESKIKYIDLPIKYESVLHRNSYGRYETEYGDDFTCGSTIEYLSIDEKYEEYPSWKKSVIEYINENYYIAREPKLSLNGLLVRVRRFD
ncbi:MAG: DUF5348 domain-containing protein [Lachnospirales bacterium]